MASTTTDSTQHQQKRSRTPLIVMAAVIAALLALVAFLLLRPKPKQEAAPAPTSSASAPVPVGASAESWKGKAMSAGNGDSVTVGSEKTEAALVGVTCEQQGTTRRVILVAPGGASAVIETAALPATTGAVITTPEGKKVALKAQGEAAVSWSADGAALGMGFPMKVDGAKLYFREVSCAR